MTGVVLGCMICTRTLNPNYKLKAQILANTLKMDIDHEEIPLPFQNVPIENYYTQAVPFLV